MDIIYFKTFIENNRLLAETKSIEWDLPINTKGIVLKNRVWDLSRMVGADPIPRSLLSILGTDKNTLNKLNIELEKLGKPPISERPLPSSWQNLIKAVVIHALFIKKLTPSYAADLSRTIRVLATCLIDVNPWELTADDTYFAYTIARKVQASGKLALHIDGVVKTIIDDENLSTYSPIFPAHSKQTSSFKEKKNNSRKNLNDRKSPNKLPDMNAFWTLLKIVYTEKPKTFIDSLRFIQIQLLILNAHRGGEVAIYPKDWRRERPYFNKFSKNICDKQLTDPNSNYSIGLSIRHFAEKSRDTDIVSYFENTQSVPEIFQQSVTESMTRADELTHPLRKRLKQQILSGRLFPEYAPDELVPVLNFYPRLSGSPFIYVDKKQDELIKEYKKSFDIQVLYKIKRRQAHRPGPLRKKVNMFFLRMHNVNPLPYRYSNGSYVTESKYLRYNDLRLRVDELEEYLRKHTPTKLPDIDPITLSNGDKVYPHELMFLMPKRTLIDGRNNKICDITQYMPVGRVDSQDLIKQLSSQDKTNGIFNNYGETEAEKNYGITPHPLRHLQNTELFRHGVADTIITKRFNRRNVAQSYEYDHRSLAEDLESISIPPQFEEKLGPNASIVFKMIEANLIGGPIINDFKYIQKNQGDDAAIDFLAVEADGYHITPYGVCLTSFMVDPCPNYLQCFNGCRHLAASPITSHKANLVKLKERLLVNREQIIKLPAENIGIKNQLIDITKKISNVEKTLVTEIGEKPFPEGENLFKVVGGN